MDSESQQMPDESLAPVDLESENRPPSHHLEQLHIDCNLCRQLFLEAETIKAFDDLFICKYCMPRLLNLLETSHPTSSTARETSQGRLEGQVRSESSGSTDYMFSRPLTELISLARQNYDTQQLSGYNIYHSRSSRTWCRHLSDTGSESHDHGFCFGDDDSIISITVHGAESDVSLDGHSYIDTENFIQQDGESHVSSDTDIDPMYAGLDHWIPDEYDDVDYGEWEEDEGEEAIETVRQDAQIYSASSNQVTLPSFGRDDDWHFWSVGYDGFMHHHFNDMDETEYPLFHDHSRLISTSYEVLLNELAEEVLDELAEDTGTRHRLPPAAASCLTTLPLVIITEAHEKNGSLVCAVCKELLHVGTETNCLPCLHFYHPYCILPWLCRRRTCPVCRYELPTDDPDYEDGKRDRIRNIELNETPDGNIISVGESSSIMASDEERVELEEEEEHGEENRSYDQRGIGGWRYLAEVATPIVSIFGMVLVLWLGTTPSCIQGRDSNNLLRNNNTVQETRVIRHRRWWSFQF